MITETTQQPNSPRDLFEPNIPYFYVSLQGRNVSNYFATADEAKQWREDNQHRFTEKLDCYKAMYFM